MMTKTNLIGAVLIAAATFTAAPASNATVAAGQMAATAATAIQATSAIASLAGEAGVAETAAANFKLAGGKRRRWHRWHRHWRHGHGYWGHGCYWLKRKARRTGRKYWWNRYYDCIDGYY